MRAMLCHAWGPVENLRLGDAPVPVPSDGEVAIAVKAVGINYADAIMVAGNYQTKPPLPFSPGLEAAGIVAACGARVTRFKPGDRVMAILAHGGLAELAVAPEAETFAIPDAHELRRRRAPFPSPTSRATSPSAGRAVSSQARRCWCWERRAGWGSLRWRSARPWARA
jgi:hypothetical protein